LLGCSQNSPPDRFSLAKLYYNSHMETTYFANFSTPLGQVLVRADKTSVTGLWFCERQRYLPDEATRAAWVSESKHPALLVAGEWLEVYFAGEVPAVEVPISASGTMFQILVWQLLRQIPYGTVVTYKELAARFAFEFGLPKAPAAQAIGGAVGRNPISLIIPCHRIVGSSGRLTGYGGGLDRKTALLELEGVAL